MTPEEFKQIRICSFSDFSDSTLEHYIQRGNEILAKGKTIDNEIMEIVDNLLLEKEKRGK